MKTICVGINKKRILHEKKHLKYKRKEDEKIETLLKIFKLKKLNKIKIIKN